MVWLLWECGLKVSQLVSLRLEQVDVERTTTLIYGRDGGGRMIPFSRQTAERYSFYLDHARRYLAQPGNPFVFVSRLNKPLTRQGFWLVLKRLSENKQITTEKIRNTRAAHLHFSGYSIEEIQEFLGHNDIINTRTLMRSIKNAYI
jgi:integrase/recombinase XerD